MSGSSSTSKKAKSEYIPENVLFGRLLLKSGPELVGRLVTKPKFLTLTGYEVSKQIPTFHTNDLCTFKRLRSRNQENFVICPILIDIILMGIRLGAGEETANEIKVALQHTAIDRPELKRTAKALIHVLREEDRSLYQFYSIQKMFVRSGHTIKRNFKILSEGAFYLDIEALNFRDVANAENKINRYVNNRTLSAVEGIVPSGLLSSECKIVIASSAYYWAEWDAEINRAYTNIQTFMCSPNYAVQVEFMHSVASYGYLDCEPLGVRFLQMHLKNKQGALIIALPRNTFGLARLEENIEAVLNVSDKDFKDRRMRIAMPKFVISTTQDWKELLMEVGPFNTLTTVDCLIVF